MKYPSHMQLMYNYFYYFDVPEFTKENYILKEIAPNLIDDELIKVFEFEIERLIASTGHYKALYTFKKKIQLNKQKQ